MLNEKRVKHMVKLAKYEAKQGTEDLRASSYFKGDYISFNVLCTLLWATVGFVIIGGLLGFGYLDMVLEDLTLKKGLFIILAFIIAYVVLMIIYGVIAYFFYRDKHFSARQNIKKFGRGLEVLEKMYEKEDDKDGKDI